MHTIIYNHIILYMDFFKIRIGWNYYRSQSNFDIVPDLRTGKSIEKNFQR